MYKTNTKLLVVNENTLCFKATETGDILEVLATRKREGVLPLNPAIKRTVRFRHSSDDFVRPATINDFTAFGVEADDYVSILINQETSGYDAAEMRFHQADFLITKDTTFTANNIEVYSDSIVKLRTEASALFAKSSDAQREIQSKVTLLTQYAEQRKSREALQVVSEISYIQLSAANYYNKAKELEKLANDYEKRISADCIRLGQHLYSLCHQEFAETTVIPALTEMA